MSNRKQEVSNQTVSKHYGYSAQVLSDWKRSSKVEHNRRVKALYDAYKKFLENKKEEK